MIAALVRGSPLTDAVVAANAAGSEAVARLGAVGEVEVAGISTAGQTLGAKFIDRVAAASRRGAAPAPRRRAKDTAAKNPDVQNRDGEEDQ